LALNRQQKYADAEKQFRELIIVEERVLGPDHPETLRSRRNLFVTLGNQGKHAAAEAGFRDLLRAEERVLGPEHPDTIGICNNIGFALAQQQRFADAESQFRQVVGTEEKVLGPEHPATLSSRMALASILSQQEKYAEADAQCREVIALEEKVLGPEHPTTISSWYAFAYQLARQNKIDEAMQFARRAATTAEQAFGQEHPDTRKYAQLVQQLVKADPRTPPLTANVPASQPTNAEVVDVHASPKEDFDAAKQEYEQSSGDEAARVTYVTKLAQISERLLREYPRNDERIDNLKRAINSELEKHPAPKNTDSKKLKQLLVGEWASPRRVYVYRANGKWGAEGGAIDGNWRIEGNQLIQGDLSGPIILLNRDYFIYSSRDAVFFHSRVKE
jgi:tetratricopeptide (TPR) repeat protein